MKLDFNEFGRDFVIGDLHGCYDLLQDRLWRSGFNKKTDRLFSVGDLIDRGPDSMKCLELIEEDWFYPVIGNHEKMMMDVILDGEDGYLWVANGGQWHLEEDYQTLRAYCEMLKKVPYSYTIEGKVGICHAQPPSVDWNDTKNPSERDIKIMLWARSWIEDRLQDDVENIVYTIHGHTPIQKPMTVANATFIDTGAFHSGNLTMIEIPKI